LNEKVNAEILREFVNKVIVYNVEKVNGHRQQKIQIVYNCIGTIDLMQQNEKNGLTGINRLADFFNLNIYPLQTPSLEGANYKLATQFQHFALCVLHFSLHFSPTNYSLNDYMTTAGSRPRHTIYYLVFISFCFRNP
jgi:hypothetical protein